jgi:dTMP kinase
LGDAVRRGIQEDVNVLSESFLFLADRAAHVLLIRSHVGRGELVICDRYVDSTFAYQGARLVGVVHDPIRFLKDASRGWVLPPDLTIFLRVPPKLAIERIKDRPSRIRFEDLALLRRVAANYDRLAKARRFAVLDGTRPAKVVSEDAVSAIERRVATRGSR